MTSFFAMVRSRRPSPLTHHARPAPLPPVVVCAGPRCSAAWHMRCLPVPLVEVPPEDWLCPSCDPPPDDAPLGRAPPDAPDKTEMIAEGEAAEAEGFAVAECSFLSSLPPSPPSSPAADSAPTAGAAPTAEAALAGAAPTAEAALAGAAPTAGPALPADATPAALLAPLAALPPAPSEPAAVLTPPPLAVAVVSMQGGEAEAGLLAHTGAVGTAAAPGRGDTPAEAVSAVVVDIDEPEEPGQGEG